MTEFACIMWDDKADHPVRFYGRFTSQDGHKEDPEAIRAVGGVPSSEVRVSAVTPEEVSVVSSHLVVMREFVGWVDSVNHRGRPMFISDNNGFDYQFINYYCHKYVGRNPFGHSSTNLGSLYKGMAGSMFSSFKSLRKTQHTHHPIDDCMGNLEAMDTMLAEGHCPDGFGPDSSFPAHPPRANQA